MSEPGQHVSAVSDWESLARGAVRQNDDGEETVLLRELLTFHLGSDCYALPVERVREIVRLREVTKVPRVPQWVIGVVALRGEIVQVVDLRMRLGLDRVEASRRSRIIVLHGDDERITGMLVDAVDQVLRVDEDNINPSSNVEAEAVVELCDHDGEFISIIDVDKVLDHRDG
jgi:purine-binding chemotaxis protein CheW